MSGSGMVVPSDGFIFTYLRLDLLLFSGTEYPLSLTQAIPGQQLRAYPTSPSRPVE